MTLEELGIALQQCGRTWSIHPLTGHIRSERGECPICAACNHLRGTMFIEDFSVASARLGLNVNDGYSVAAAADMRNDTRLRPWLEGILCPAR